MSFSQKAVSVGHELAPGDARFTDIAIRTRKCAEALGVECPLYATPHEVWDSIDPLAVELVTDPDNDIDSYKDAEWYIYDRLGEVPKVRAYAKATPHTKSGRKATRWLRKLQRKAARNANWYGGAMQ